MHITLPLMTRALFALGQGLKSHPLMVIAIHCVVIGSLAFAYKQHSIKCKVHRWLWLLAHRYQWSTCVYYTSMLKSLGSLTRFWYFYHSNHEYYSPFVGEYIWC